MRYLFLLICLCAGCCPVHSPQSAHKKQSPRLFLDAGHGGRDSGAKVPALEEKTLSLEIAHYAEQFLRKMGYQISMSRTSDTFVPLLERVAKAQKWGAHAFISIHFNSAKVKTARGPEAFYYYNPKFPKRAEQSKELAFSILEHLSFALSTPSRGVKKGNFCVIRETTMPAVLVETAFLTNPQEARLLLPSNSKRQIAMAIARGIDEFFEKR